LTAAKFKPLAFSVRGFALSNGANIFIIMILLRSILSYASPVWGYTANTYINKLQIFQNKVLRIITKLPRVTPIATLHEQTGMSLIGSHIKRLVRELHQKFVTSEKARFKN
jgi:hypothetical protein